MDVAGDVRGQSDDLTLQAEPSTARLTQVQSTLQSLQLTGVGRTKKSGRLSRLAPWKCSSISGWVSLWREGTHVYTGRAMPHPSTLRGSHVDGHDDVVPQELCGQALHQRQCRVLAGCVQQHKCLR